MYTLPKIAVVSVFYIDHVHLGDPPSCIEIYLRFFFHSHDTGILSPESTFAFNHRLTSN